MNIFARAWNRIIGKSSRGEKFILSALPGMAGVRSPFTWSTNRIELANHFTGWPYIAISTAAETIAGIAPCLAYRHDAASYASHKAAAYQTKGMGKRAAIETFRRKFLDRTQRAKALAPIQPNEELEPVGYDHPLLKLWHRPNPTDTAWTLSYKIDLFLGLTGSAFLIKIFNGYGDLSELWCFPSQWMWPVIGKTTFALEYEVRPVVGVVPIEMGVGWFAGGGGLRRIKAEDVIPIQMPNPVNPFDGWSPLMAVGSWVQVAENMDSSRVAHFTNGMFFGVALEIDKEVADPSEEMIESVKMRVAQHYAGVRNTGKPLILGPGIKLVPTTTTPAEMDYVNGADQQRGNILAAYKTPTSVIGLGDQSTFASMVASQANYHQIAIRPKLVYRGQIFTEHLAKLYDDRLIWYWPDSVPNDPAHELAKWQAAMQSQCATPNEFRTHVLGIEPFENGGDDPIAPMGVSPMPLGTGDEYDDILVPALAAQKADADAEKAEGQLDKGDAAEVTADDKPDDSGDRAALGEKPQEGPAAKARNRLRDMSAMKHLNGFASKVK